MIDTELERKLADMTTLLKLWNLFQQFFESAVKGVGVTPENERKFLELKSRIAMLHDTFMAVVPESIAAVGQAMIDNVVRSITLKHLSRLNSADIKKMQLEWHESYLLLNESIGLLEEEQLRISKVSATQFQTQRAGHKVSIFVGRFYHSWGLRISLGIVAILVVLIGLPMMGVFSYGGLRDVAAIQPVVYPLIEHVVRPYINSNLAWRTIDEAIEHGRLVPTTVFSDYVADHVTPDLNVKDGALRFVLNLTHAQPIGGRDSLMKATEYRAEKWKVGATKDLTAFYFLIDTVPNAKKTVEDLKGYLAKSPGAGTLDVVNDYNLVMILHSAEPMNRGLFAEKVWKIKKGAQ